MVVVPRREKRAFHDELLAWSEENLRSFPWRETMSPYEVLVAEVLLGATMATKVESLYAEFLDRYPDFESLAEADVDELANLLEPLGLQNRRAKAFGKIGQRYRDEPLPQDLDQLLELPYVGPYAANATLCFAFGERRPILDTNVAQIYERAFDVELDVESPESWAFAEAMLPETEVRRYNLALLDFGAKVCVSGTPKCEVCFFTHLCRYYSDFVATN